MLPMSQACRAHDELESDGPPRPSRLHPTKDSQARLSGQGALRAALGPAETLPFRAVENGTGGASSCEPP